MNVVGKVFIVVIFTMSLMFMALALMLDAAHPDFRSRVIAKGGLKDQLDVAKSEKQKLVDEKKLLEQRIFEEKDRYVKRVAALEQVKVELTKEREANAKSILEREDALKKLVEAIDSIHNTVKSLQAETVAMRGETKTAIQDRRRTFEKAIPINDDLLNAVVQRLRLEKLGRELRAQLTKLSPTASPVRLPDSN